MFSRGRETVHWQQMGQSVSCPDAYIIYCNIIVLVCISRKPTFSVHLVKYQF